MTTNSFNVLEILLGGPLYRGGTQTTMGPPGRISRAALKEAVPVRAHTEGYAAITDSPASLFAPELIGLYPEAKVIMTVRERDAWVKSMAQISSLVTMWFLRGILRYKLMRHFVTYIELLQAQWDARYNGSRDNIWIYDRHIELLNEVVPADRLVFFNVKKGWEHLCRALGKEVPKDIPFPRVNDSKAINRRGLRRWAVAFAVVGVLGGWWVLG
ncbi:sulfotransferase family protein [Aspergillus vadensis CBS 113365]|uniref:NAD dependent epimerase/dehydratase n=1 Tax=Aspergillus vadensis (strain CBS 113365 / IMI 142717 / IBT 24658) TaxID=1448311 RepID=A0A319C797_ASPVC|nr:hypothetical protein BO88DRAFT_423958 [Aspergillus vadensis CBS 113365]PYH71208.1 hypothetical protein BO88DRAFT_423958 [Aspergillus vadensis CBS 113365]